MVLITFLSFPSSPPQQVKVLPNTALVVRIRGGQVGSSFLNVCRKMEKVPTTTQLRCKETTKNSHYDESCHSPPDPLLKAGVSSRAEKKGFQNSLGLTR